MYVFSYIPFVALSLTSCDNPLENEVCNLTCTTTDHSQTVAFNKEPDSSIIAQCVSGIGCFGTSQYSISQPNSVTTVLSFMHSRSNSGTWGCSYGLTSTSVSVPWASKYSYMYSISFNIKMILALTCGPTSGDSLHWFDPTSDMADMDNANFWLLVYLKLFKWKISVR